jgi:hypothetical protein
LQKTGEVQNYCQSRKGKNYSKLRSNCVISKGTKTTLKKKKKYFSDQIALLSTLAGGPFKKDNVGK